ncbi:hypothetical protein ACWCYZ_39270 [Streptomyces virginiae]
MAVPPGHDSRDVDDTPHQLALRQAGAHALETAVVRARDRAISAALLTATASLVVSVREICELRDLTRRMAAIRDKTHY